MTRVAALAMWLGLSAGAAAQEAAGIWELDVAFPRRDARVELEVGPDSTGTLAAVWRGPQGELHATDVQMQANVITFVLTAEDQRGNPLQMHFRATIEGNVLTGALRLGPNIEATVSGRRRERR